LTNISKLVGITAGELEKRGEDMGKVNCIDNAYIIVDNDVIENFGPMQEYVKNDKIQEIQISHMVLPALVDCHTHAVFSKTRDLEFVQRNAGMSYQEIAKNGGGILHSSHHLQKTSEEALFEMSLERINKIEDKGLGTIEIKSGYGLTVNDEIKMLRVIRRISKESNLIVKSTFLGAHAFPEKYKDNHSFYIDSIVKEMLPQIVEENLADFIDVFCEPNYFNLEETERILQAGQESNLGVKVHVNQFNSFGGLELALDYGALSVDHLEVLTEEDIELLRDYDTMPVLLPACSFFISIPYAPARKLISAGLPIALASDFNPGSSHVFNPFFIWSLACLKMKMTPEEAFNALTINAAKAIGLQKQIGSIEKGKKAKLIAVPNVERLSEIPYQMGEIEIQHI